jgi:xanthine dehydrogenase accessory factor
MESDWIVDHGPYSEFGDLLTLRGAQFIGALGTCHEALRPLAIRPEQIRLVMNDTAVAPNSGPSGGSRLEVLLELIVPASPAATAFAGWREALRARQRGLFLTVLRFAGKDIVGVGHCLLKNQNVACGDVPLSPAGLEKLTGEHSNAVGLRTVTPEESLVLIEPILPAEPVFLFGAGHVARPTAQLAAFAGFRVRVVDDRAEFANAERFSEAEEVLVVADFDTALDGCGIDRSAFIVIVTRGHLHNKTVLSRALRTEAGYIGMIGSRRERDHLFNALLKDGIQEADLRRVHSPIGLDIGAETPKEIAISIVAELVHTRAQRRRP